MARIAVTGSGVPLCSDPTYNAILPDGSRSWLRSTFLDTTKSGQQRRTALNHG
ncbi:MAG: hypothetical protein WCA28_16435 [Bradyrhizobium sp.]